MELAQTPIRVAEPALTARLRLGFPARDFTLDRVPAVISAKEFARLTSLMPFIGLQWVGMTADQAAGRGLAGVQRWRLMLVNKASSSPETRFKGDTRGIGLDAMVDVASALLNGWTIEGLGAVRVTGAEASYAEGFEQDAVVVAQIDFTIRFESRVASLELKDADALLRLGAVWLNAASADPDEGPDAAQTITLGAQP